MNDTHVIEGELADEPRQDVVTQQDRPAAIFNPLDAEPVSFERQLANRQDNYDALQLHLQGVLVAGQDFDRIHHANKEKCPEPWDCTYEQNRGHWSGYQLLAPGADKILGILGLAPHYPDMKDYKRAPLRGIVVEDVILDCHILGHNGQVIAEGPGACSRREMKGDLNNTIKRAAKRARLEAVKRLPVVSALFEDKFLEQMAQAQAIRGQQTAAKRAQKLKNIWDTGAELAVCPIGESTKGKPWRDIETDKLAWMVQNITDKPDITRAARRELEKRDPSGSPEPDSIRTGGGPASEEGQP